MHYKSKFLVLALFLVAGFRASEASEARFGTVTFQLGDDDTRTFTVIIASATSKAFLLQRARLPFTLCEQFSIKTDGDGELVSQGYPASAPIGDKILEHFNVGGRPLKIVVQKQ